MITTEPATGASAAQDPRRIAFATRTPAIPTNATDIPGFSKSSSGRGVVCPGGVFVVEGVGLQAAVQDADEAVRELA